MIRTLFGGVVLMMVLALAGCQNRVIWDDDGAAERATRDREIWNSQGRMESGDRRIWNDRDGKPVIQ